MIEAIDDRVQKINGVFHTKCINCGIQKEFKFKESALKMLRNKRCINCLYSNLYKEEGNKFFKNSENKWCKKCSLCGKLQCYSRKEHAVNSVKSDKFCRACNGKRKHNNASVGNFQRYYNKFYKSAIERGLEWNITKEYIESIFTNKCSLSGWEISADYGIQSASLDRIDSSVGYIVGNVQWVRAMVNMCKNKYDENLFIKMCIDIAETQKWKKGS